jgi:hypothetical protein
MQPGRLFSAASVLALAIISTPNSALSQPGKAKIFGEGAPSQSEDLPPGRVRSHLESLPLPARQQALQWLQRFSFPENDLDFLQLDRDGGVFYADTFELELAASEAPSGTQLPEAITPTDTFLLHSRPGASKVIFLDFDGHTITNTAWNSGRPDPLYARPFDTDGNFAVFSDEELHRIGEIWHRVAEDFAPFDIDVTTEDPGNFGPTTGRVLITNSQDATGNDMPHPAAGGVAYVGVWGYSNYEYYSPALVYANRLGGGGPTYVAEAASHEFGHNLNLSHDGRTSPAEGYYQGHGAGYVSWAPIMGVGYYQNVTQWSKGEYANANNKQDDLNIIDFRLGYRADDHGNALAAASPLLIEIDGNIVATNPQADPHDAYSQNKGVIELSNDIDMFAFDASAGTVNITVEPGWAAFYRTARRGANLDIQAALYDQQGTQLAASDPLDNTNATISTTVAGGSYYLAITGVGNSVSPYSDYASLGQYFITGSIIPGTEVTEPPVAPTVLTATTVSHNQINLSWSDNADNETGFRIDRSPDQISWVQIAQLSLNTTSHSDMGLSSDTTYYYRARAFNTAGESSNTNIASATTTSQPMPPTAPTGSGASDGQNGTATITWVDNSDNETGFELQREKRHKKRAVWQETTLVATSGPDTNSYTDASGTGTFRYRIRAINAAGASSWSTWSEVTVSDAGGGDKPCRGKKCN